VISSRVPLINATIHPLLGWIGFFGNILRLSLKTRDVLPILLTLLMHVLT